MRIHDCSSTDSELLFTSSLMKKEDPKMYGCFEPSAIASRGNNSQ